MVSNLFEILKAMQIPSAETDFGTVMELMKKDDMRTFVKLTASLLILPQILQDLMCNTL